MTSDTYCTFEQAKLLKEKGLQFDDIYCEYGYVIKECYDSHDYPCYHQAGELIRLDGCGISSQDIIITPTLSLAQKWFKDEKNIIIEPTLYNPCYPIEYETVIYCDYDGHHFSKLFEGVYDTYEKALSVGIDKALTLITSIKTRVQKYQTCHADIEDGSREQFLIGKAYYDGATDQLKIDVDKACKYLARYTDMFIQPGGLLDADNFIKDFRQSMEE